MQPAQCDIENRIWHGLLLLFSRGGGGGGGETTALIRLHGCERWSAHLLFACNKISFSGHEGLITLCDMPIFASQGY